MTSEQTNMAIPILEAFLYHALLHCYCHSMEEGRPLYFCPVVSFFFFSSPNLSRHRLTDWMSTILLHIVWP